MIEILANLVGEVLIDHHHLIGILLILQSKKHCFHDFFFYFRDRSRSPRDRDRDRDRHGPPRGDDRRGGRGGRGGDRGGGRGGHYNNPREPHQSRFGPDNNPPPWHDRRDGGRGGGRGGFHDRSHDMGGHYRANEQLPSGKYYFIIDEDFYLISII